MQQELFIGNSFLIFSRDRESVGVPLESRMSRQSVRAGLPEYFVGKKGSSGAGELSS